MPRTAIIAGWEVDGATDGTVRVRQLASVRISYGLTLLGIGLLVAVGSAMMRPGASPVPFYFIALLLLGCSLWAFFGKLEWRATLGLLEQDSEHLGVGQTWRFTKASLVFRLFRGYRGGYAWHLWAEEPGRRRFLAKWWAPDLEMWEGTEIATLAHTLAEATGFPIRDEQGKAHCWPARSVPGQPPGGIVQILHLHTGRVMERIPCGTLAGAHLAKTFLEGADLHGTDLTGADLAGTHLEGASLKDAKLMNAKLTGALLTAADLSGADLTGADLTGAKLIGATYDACTRWPAGFEAARHGAVLAE